MTIKEEIEAEIYRVIAEADASGKDPMSAYREAFPGAPDGPYWEAWCKLDDEKEKAWFDGMVRTIDADVIQRANLAVANPTKANGRS